MCIRDSYWDDQTVRNIVEITTKGLAPDMPAFGDRLNQEEILALAHHIEANFRPGRTPNR